MLQGKNILLGISGGIAAYKTPHIVRLLRKKGANVKVVMTNVATHFVSELALATVAGEAVYRSIVPNAEEHGCDFTAHISLGEWADAFIVAPTIANTLAKLAAGLCDDMLSACFLTLRPDKPVLLFPAMDGEMFRSPSVQRNIETLVAQACHIAAPENGELASGLCGLGRMPEPENIVAALEQAFTDKDKPSLLQGKSIVVTAGPTREKIDGVRFISNYSSGKMGFAIAQAAAACGAAVTLISGPVSLATPSNVTRIDVESAAEMYAAAAPLFAQCDIFISAAAVADYRPATPFDGKLKKQAENMELTLVRNPDILAAFGKQKQAGQLAVGFALETENGIENATKKLTDKQLDLIALNSYDRTSTGFEVDTNMLTLINRNGIVATLPLQSKQAAAKQLLDAIETLVSNGNN